MRAEEELWYQFLTREKAFRDEVSRINYANSKGIEEGRKEGIAIGERCGEKKANQKTTLNLLQQGVDIAIISSATGLSENDILSLRNGKL